jgi:hypothetical protein
MDSRVGGNPQYYFNPTIQITKALPTSPLSLSGLSNIQKSHPHNQSS